MGTRGSTVPLCRRTWNLNIIQYSVLFPWNKSIYCFRIENCALMGYYTKCCSNSLLTCRDSLFQMKPARCTLLLSVFISTSLHVSGNYVPIVRRTYFICATLVFFTLYGWLSGLLVGMRLVSSLPTSEKKLYRIARSAKHKISVQCII